MRGRSPHPGRAAPRLRAARAGRRDREKGAGVGSMGKRPPGSRPLSEPSQKSPDSLGWRLSAAPSAAPRGEPVIMITLTAGAAQKVKNILEQEKESIPRGGLRIYVQGGGCSGFQYGMVL